MTKYKYAMIYFDDTISEAGTEAEVSFINTLANCNICSVSSNDYNSLLRQAEGMKRRFWIGLLEDAEVMLKHVLPVGE